MGEKLQKFEDYEYKVKDVQSFEALFQIWKEAQDLENDELEQKIREKQKKGDKRGDGDIFEHDFYKKRGKNNKNTISSHFIQFFYKACEKCNIAGTEFKCKKVWKYVLENAFNMDGCAGELEIPNDGYEYIFLLKEANDSKKVCAKENYPNFECKAENVNVWLQEWANNDASAPMLDKLYNAMKELKNNKISKKDFLNLAAYMNVNKRGGDTQTAGYDRTAVVNYAEKYRKFILKEICLLAGNKERITVFAAGKGKDYYQPLIEALDIQNTLIFLGEEEKREIKFVNISHPSKPGMAYHNLKKEMNEEK